MATAAMSTQPRTLLPPTGVYPSVPFDEYQRWPAASNSGLTKLLKSAAHLRAYLDEPQKDTTALLVGRAVHTAILEPDTFTSRFTIAEQCHATTKAGAPCSNSGIMFCTTNGWLCGVHAKQAVSLDHSRIVLPEAEYVTCLAVRSAVHTHRSAHGLLAGAAQHELSTAWQQPTTMRRPQRFIAREDMIPCKGRFDAFSPGIAGGAIVDIKTTRDASRSGFERSIFSYGYHRQAALYLEGAHYTDLSAKHFVFIAVEKEPPFAVAVYRLEEDAVQAGRDQLEPLLGEYWHCVAENDWPAYLDAVQDIALPKYAWEQINEQVAEAAAS